MIQLMLKCARPLTAPCAIAMLGWFWTHDAHAAEPEPSLVTVASVEAQQLAPVMWVPANVISRHDSQIASEQEGQIVWVAEIGSKLKRGDTLARIDTETLKLRLAEQDAVLKRLRASESYYEKQLRRLETLIANNSIARTEIDATERDRAINDATIQQQQALIAQTKLAINKATITAPFDGVVSQQRVQQGEYVRTGQAVAQLVDIAGLDVQVQAPIALAPFVSRSKTLSVEYGDEVLELPVRAFTPTGNVTSRTFELRLDARQLAAVPGLAVKVAVPKALAAQTLVIPRDALVIREQQMYVLRVAADGVAHRLPVTAGAGTGDKIAVTAELKAGDRVITRGAESTQHGQKVRIANASLRGGDAPAEKVASHVMSVR
jgi:membrane fusion protein, multidrug efflux system